MWNHRQIGEEWEVLTQPSEAIVQSSPARPGSLGRASILALDAWDDEEDDVADDEEDDDEEFFPDDEEDEADDFDEDEDDEDEGEEEDV